MKREKPRLKEVFHQEGIGRFIKDEKENRGFILRGKTLSQIKEDGMEKEKGFVLDGEISAFTKDGGEMGLLLENNKLLFFKDDQLQWKVLGKQLGMGKSKLYQSLALLLVLTIIGTLGGVISVFVSIESIIHLFMYLFMVLGVFTFLISLALKFFPSVEKELYLADINDDKRNEIIISVNNRRFVFLDGSTGKIIHEVNIEKDYTEKKIIKLPKMKEEKEIWVRVRKDEKCHVLIITMKGVKKKIPNMNLIEVFDWNSDGVIELASVSRDHLRIHTINGSILFDTEIVFPLTAYAGNLRKREGQELVLLGKKDQTYCLYFLMEKNLFKYEMDIAPMALQVVGVADIDEDNQDEIIFKALWEDKGQIHVYKFI